LQERILFMRTLVVIGTRPEAIKLAPVVRQFQKTRGIEVETCITSQHRDLLRPMLDFFGLEPEYDLDVMTPGQTLGDVTTRILSGMSQLLRGKQFDWVVVQGDTTTAFAAGLAGFYERVRVAHVEAGLRSGDLANPFPEEANRRFIDVFADSLLVPTSEARDNLLREGAPSSRIFITGNTGIDALLLAVDIVRRQKRRLPVTVEPGKKLVLVTAHRRESFGQPLERVFSSLVELTRTRPDVEILLPLHPNPNVRATAGRLLVDQPRIHLVEPLEYPDFVTAMLAADLILTDSGGVQEEAPVLGKAVLVMRETTERPEGVTAGAAELVGTDRHRILKRALHHLDVPAENRKPIYVYGDGHAAERVAQVLQSGSLDSVFRAA
jgi:UDP-N-acetylglucosamine 2-epimerase (non-hydrolysing)